MLVDTRVHPCSSFVLTFFFHRAIDNYATRFPASPCKQTSRHWSVLLLKPWLVFIVINSSLRSWFLCKLRLHKWLRKFKDSVDITVVESPRSSPSDYRVLESSRPWPFRVFQNTLNFCTLEIVKSLNFETLEFFVSSNSGKIWLNLPWRGYLCEGVACRRF